MDSRIAIMIVLAMLSALASSCGGAKRCEEKKPGSFATFLDDDWRTYCADYREHIEQPGRFTMTELTEFFGSHPTRVKELNKSLYQHDKYETCFDSPKEELELRELQSCLQDNDQTDLEITNAFSAVMEPWIEEIQLREQEIAPRMSDAEREAKRLSKKVSEAFDFHNEIEGRDWDSLQVELKSLGKAISALEGVDEQFNEIRASAEGHQALVRTIDTEFAPEINAVVAEVGDLRERHTALENEARYLEFAASSAGVKCPKSLRGANKELRTARKVVKGRNNEVGGSGPRILTKTNSDSSGDTDFERFEGFVCGIRGTENQWDGKPQLCAQYRFVVERQKPSSERKWGDWRLKSFEEAGSSGGIDCALKKK